MSLKGLAASAAETAGARFVGNKATKAIESLPKPKQNKIRGVLMVATAIMLLVSGFKLLKKDRNIR